MTTEEMDRAIAEHLGWRCVDVYEWDQSTFPATRRPKQFHIQDNGMAVNLPRYSTDLNAMHEAEKTLTDEDFEQHYGKFLGAAASARSRRAIVSATASQRAKAFVMTINKWREA